MSDGATIIYTMDVKPEMVDTLLGAFPEMLKDTAKFDGFRSIRIVRDGNKVNLIEVWDSAAHYDAYIAWRTGRGDMDMIGQMVNSAETQVWPTLVLAA